MGAGISDLVLWGSPRDGREFVRGERAFAGLQDARHGAEEDQVLADGSIQSGGFVLSAEWLDELSTLNLISGADGLRHVLLLDRDGIALADKVVDGLRATECRASGGSGGGHGAFVIETRVAALWTRVAGVVATAGSLGGLRHDKAWPPPPPLARTHLALAGCQEHVVRIHLDQGSPFLVVTVPDHPREGAPTVALLPAWAMRRSGPNRMWTEVARLAAAHGYITAHGST